MNGQYAYTPQIWPSVGTVLLLIVLAVYAWRHRSVPGALPFTFALLFGALWAAGYVLEYLAVDPAAKITWVKFQMAWQLPSATAVAFFLLEYAWPGRWLTRRNLALLSIVPVLVILLILTDHLHHLVWHGFVLNKTVTPLLGPIGWITIVYGYSLTIVNFIVFGWLFVRSPQHRWAVVLIVISQIFFRAVYLLDKTRTLQSTLPLVVIGMAFVCLMYTVALFRFHLLSPLPLARQRVIDQMREGMLVLDTEGQVVGLNLAGERIIGLSGRQVKGKPVREVLPAYPDELKMEANRIEIEFSLPTDRGASDYRLVISRLNDWRGQEVGRLLLLRDVTEQKRAQAQILEQQRSLAILHEREQLARELHDSLGQVFAFVNMQGQTVRRLLSRGDVSTADEYVGRLLEAAREADVDIRESIMGLRAAISEHGLLPTLTQYLTRYEKNYGIQTRLEGSQPFTDGAFEPLVEVQLLRILQEALTNVRKHANARCVQIAFALEDGWARVTVQDDGRGFDPGASSAQMGEHVGLRVMRERAEEVGGSLSLRSASGQGTELVVRVPLKGADHA
jgi:PAS domain S-box-containing protein